MLAPGRAFYGLNGEIYELTSGLLEEYAWNRYSIVTQYRWNRYNTITQYNWARYSVIEQDIIRYRTKTIFSGPLISGYDVSGIAGTVATSISLNAETGIITMNDIGDVTSSKMEDGVYYTSKRFVRDSSAPIEGYYIITFSCSSTVSPDSAYCYTSASSRQWDRARETSYCADKYIDGTEEVRGSYITAVSSTIDNSYPDDGKASDGYWYTRTGSSQVIGSYIDQVTSTDSGLYPANGVSGNYWYTSAGSEQIQGSIIDTVYAYNENEYPTNGIQDDYWYVKQS